MELGLSFDDVLLVPKKSSIKSRKEVCTQTFLTRKIKLSLPIISSNMDTVTESDMAIAMAELGGIGIIHRFNTIEQQVEEVKKVKRFRNAIIEKPYILRPDDTIGKVVEIKEKLGFSSFLVVDDDNKLIGIITPRDMRFKPLLTIKISELMTKKQDLIVGKKNITIEEAKKLMIKHKIEKIPIINDDWTIAGLITGRDVYKKTKYPNSTLDSKMRLRVGAAIGVKDEDIERAAELIKADVDFLLIDIAHGHSDLEINILKKIKTKFPNIEVIAGNVCTAQGTLDLIKAGADAIKIGVGPGSICITRIVSGAGYPQLSAIIKCAEVADKYNIPVIADGGIKASGDISKAIAAGASTVMLGSLLAGTDEAPGKTILKNGSRVKVIRGMASYGAKLGRNEKISKEQDISDYVPEGVEAVIPFKGKVSDIIFQLIGGFKSGMSYVGAKKIEEIRGKCEFVRITNSGLRESHSHDVNLI